MLHHTGLLIEDIVDLAGAPFQPHTSVEMVLILIPIDSGSENVKGGLEIDIQCILNHNDLILVFHFETHCPNKSRGLF